MKFIITALSFIFLAASGFAQEKSNKISQPDPNKKIQVVEASCGECQFHMAGKGCELAVRINGKSYFVDGTSIDEHGDAHGADGFCEAIRKADVQGEVVNNRFKASYFKLKPVKEEKLQ
jgi:hypothetical protein